MRAILRPAALAGLIFCVLSSASAADVSGLWTGTIDIADTGSGSPVSTPVQLRLVQKGDALTGSIGREGDPDQVEIQNGRIEGNKVSFEAAAHETKGAMRFSLVADGISMRGEMNGAVEQGKIAGRVSLTREGK